MPMYRKKPVVIEACRLNGVAEGVAMFEAPTPEWIVNAVADQTITSMEVDEGEVVLGVVTLEGTHQARPGDYIIRGIAGELYPCKPEIFEQTYELVEAGVEGNEAAH